MKVDTKPVFSLVMRIVRIEEFYDIPTSEIFTNSGNTSSQTSQTVGDFYDVIGRIGSISTLKVLIADIPYCYDECKHEIFLSGTVPTIGDFYDECKHGICLSGTSGMLNFVFSCYHTLIFSEL